MPDIATTVPTITSVELVEIINDMREEGAPELRHDNFMAKIKNHPGIASPKFLGHVQISIGNGATRKSKCYHLPKREAELMVMSESLAVQTKVYDRMTALEQQTAAPASQLTATVEAAKAFPHLHQVAILLGCDTNAAAISANQAVAQLTGTNLLQLLGQTHLSAQRQDTQWFTPTELGKRHHTSARTFNLLLAEAGMQLKRGDHWEVTEAGREFARIYDTGKKHGSGAAITQIKWSPLVLPLLQLDAAVSIELPEGDGYASPL